LPIDWESIAKQVGDIRPDGTELGGVGTSGGRRALELVVGEQNLRDAVDHMVLMRPGWNTIEMLLSVMVSEVAMDRCYEMFKMEASLEIRNAAVFFLGAYADDYALKWIAEFLADENERIRDNGLRVLSRILYGLLGDNDIPVAQQLIERAERDPDPHVRERAAKIRHYQLGKHLEQLVPVPRIPYRNRY
jgi:hypothetical protein